MDFRLRLREGELTRAVPSIAVAENHPTRVRAELGDVDWRKEVKLRPQSV